MLKPGVKPASGAGTAALALRCHGAGSDMASYKGRAVTSSLTAVQEVGT